MMKDVAVSLNKPNMTQEEILLSLHLRQNELEKTIESLKKRIESNDVMVWEMFAAIIDKLEKNNIIISLPIKAKYDPFQKKLRSVF